MPLNHLKGLQSYYFLLNSAISGLRSCDRNWKVPGSNPARCSLGHLAPGDIPVET